MARRRKQGLLRRALAALHARLDASGKKQGRRASRTTTRLIRRLELLAARLDRRVTRSRQRRRKLIAFVLIAGCLYLTSELTSLVVITRTPQFQAQRLAEIAEIHIGLGHTEAAVRSLRESIALHPNRPARVLRLAELLASLRQPDQAQQVLREGLLRLPHEWGLTLQLAEHLTRRWQPNQAVALLEPLLAKAADASDEERARLFLIAGRAHVAAGQPDPGEALLRQATQVGQPTTRGQALLDLAQLLGRTWRLDEARDAIAQARALLPATSRADLVEARLLSESGHSGQALARLESLYRGPADDQPDPEARLQAARQLGELLVRSRRLTQARALAAELDSQPGAQPLASYLRGAADARQGQLAQAQEEFERLAKLLPDSSYPPILQGRLSLQRGLWDQARQAFTTALELEPGVREAELGLLQLDQRAQRWDTVQARAERLLSDSLLRPRAVCALFVLYARDPDTAQPGLARLEALRTRYPTDHDLALYTALLRLLVEPGDASGLSDLVQHTQAEAALAALAHAQATSTDAMEAIELLADLAARHPALAPARVILGQLYARLGRHDLAQLEATAALDANPQLTSARWLRVQLALAAQDLPSAGQELEALLAAHPAEATTLAALAEVRLQLDQAEQAVSLLRRAAKLAPRDARYLALLGRALTLQGDPDEALRVYRDARRLNPQEPTAYHDAATLILSRDADLALDVLREGAQATADPALAGALAAVHAIEGDPSGGLEVLRRWAPGRLLAVSADDLLPVLLQRLAGGELPSEAPTGLPPAVWSQLAGLPPSSDPPSGQARVALELAALQALGWRAQGAARARALLSERPPTALWLWWGLSALGPQATPQERRQAVRTLAGLAPSDAELAVAAAHETGTSPDERAREFQALAQRFPDDPRITLQLARQHELAGSDQLAVNAYRQALKRDPHNPAALNNLAYLLGKSPAARQEAIDLARRAVQAAPDQGAFLDTLGWLLFLDGQLEEAERHLAQAANRLPREPTVRFHLGRVLAAQGRSDRARGHLRFALVSSSGFPEQTEASALLAELEE